MSWRGYAACRLARCAMKETVRSRHGGVARAMEANLRQCGRRLVMIRWIPCYRGRCNSLPLYLRGDVRDINDHKKRELLGSCWTAMKLCHLPQYDRFKGDGGCRGGAGDAIS